MRSSWWLCGLGMVLLVVLVAVVLAQQAAPTEEGRGPQGEGRRPRWEQMTPEERAQMWERMQEHRLSRLEERLGASDEEWAVLVERVKPLLALEREEREASMPLSQALQAEGTTPDQLKQALDNYRKAREELAARREKLQAQLKEGLALRQEVVLVLEGILE